MSQEKKQNIEESFKELDEIIGKMEQSGTGLEETFELYKQGLDLIKNCNSLVENIEQQITVLEEE